MVSNNVVRYNVPMQALGQSQLGGTTPNMQGVQEQVSNNPMMGMFADPNETPEDRKLSAVLTVPMALGLYKTMDVFARVNGGAYEKSFIGRLARFGDKISASKYMKPAHSVWNFTKTKWQNLVGKSKILTALTKMPSVPENTMVKSMLHGTKEELVGEFASLVKKHVEQGGALADFKFKVGSTLEPMTDSILESIGKYADSAPAVKNSILKQVKSFCENSGKQSAVFDKLLGKLTSRTVTAEQIGNKLKAVSEASSTLGKSLPKAAIRGLHGLTWGGGIFMLMSAVSLAKAAVKTKNTEKGDKFKTFMEEFLGNISWIVTMPLGIKLMNAVGGLKNLGLTPDKLKSLRQMKAVHNAAKFSSEAANKASLDAIKAFEKASTAHIGFFGKIAKFAGKILTTGREVLKPYIIENPATAGEKFKNILGKMKFKGSNFLAYPIGLLAYMMIFSPIAEKIFVKISHGIFGKPKHSRYDEEPENNEVPFEGTQNQTVQQPEQAQPYTPIAHTSPTNLINMRQNGQVYTPTSSSSSSVSVAQAPNDDGKILEPVRTYVPSSACLVSGDLDPTAANNAMARADAAEKKALEVLAMKF